jgi:aspartate/methionine/tyrosine aminotransferase
MKIQTFELERYFAKHEFSAQYLLSSSDCESLSLLELIEMAPRERIGLWVDLKLGYTESMGHPELRQAIADTYQGFTAEEVLVVVPEEGIFLLMHALLEAGDHIVCTFPGYQSLYEIARSIGCEVSFWKPVEEEGWRFGKDDLEQLLRPETKLVVANFPHNPTGYIPTSDEYMSLIDLVSQQGIYLLSDEMYRYLEVEDGSTLPAGCELYHQAISLSGLSKSYGLPGLRIGWIAAHNHDLLARMSALKDYTTICASAPSEVLAIFALLNREKIVSSHLQRIRKNLGFLDEFFEDFGAFFQWNRPLGGSICFPRVLLPGGATRFCGELIESTGIMLAPSSVFQYGDDHVRIGFGRENLPQILDHFGRYLENARR